VNVSMPQIAVSPSPVPAPVSSPAPTGQFSAALSQATANTQNASSTPSVTSKSGNSGRGTTGTKDNGKSNGKPSSQNQTAPIAQLPNLPTDNSGKILNNTGFPAFMASQPMQTSNEADGKTSENSSPGSKPDSVAAMTAGAGANFSNLLKSVPSQTVIPAQKADAEAAATNLMTTSSGSKAMSEPVPITKSSAENENISIEQNAKMVSLNPAATAKPAVPETKPAPRESSESNSVQKTDGTPASTSHHAPAGDVQQTPTTPLPQVPLPDIKSVPAPAAQTNASSPVKTNSDAVPSSSSTPKKDGDSAQNAASQSQKNDSSALQGAIIKGASGTSQAQPAGVSTPNSNPSGQMSPVLADVKATPASATPKANEAAGKNQIPTAAAETEPTAATAQIVSPIQVAKLVEQAGQAELHVGIQAGEFGSVDIRTSMAHSQLTAEISVERGELGRAMSAELPALHDRLAEQRVPAANIILQDNSYSGHGSSGSQQGARQNQYAAENPGSFAENSEAIPFVAMESLESSTGLDIHI
jgi:hypothetical protein